MAAVAIQVIEISVAITIFLGVPALLATDWIRWWKMEGAANMPLVLSLIGFILATTSALLAALSTIYAMAVGGFRFYDPLLFKILRCGFWRSLCGLTLSIAGIGRPNTLRWHALAASVGMFCFWVAMAEAE
jgi:hypothetical protein